jgi:Flp pilus assembly protein TadG
MKDEGGALVETALSMSFLVLLLLGAVEFGRLGFAAIQVNNAAKAASQYGAQSRTTAADRAGMLTAAQNEYFNPTAVSLTSPTATTGYACNCAGSGASVSCSINSVTSPACPGSTMEVTVTFQTQASFDPLIHIPGLAGPFTLKGTAVQKVLQ